jgi:hypothetical protein
VSITEGSSGSRRNSASLDLPREGKTRSRAESPIRRTSVGAGTVRTLLLRRSSDASNVSEEEEEEDGEPSVCTA